MPLAHESGSSVRGRTQIGHGGHGPLRTALYLATLTAVRFNPGIKAHYQRLRAADKSMKVAWCAAARKLLHLAGRWSLNASPLIRPTTPARDQNTSRPIRSICSKMTCDVFCR